MITEDKKNITCKDIKTKLQETMEEVMNSGRDAFMKLPGDKYLHLAFEVLEESGQFTPICNVYLLSEEGDIDTVLYEKTQDLDRVKTTGSMKAVFKCCNCH